MNFKSLNEQLQKFLDTNMQPITEISQELAQKVANERQAQLDKLQAKVNKAQTYADNKGKQAAAIAHNRVKQIVNKIRLILDDKPGDEIPSTIKDSTRKTLIKVVKIPFKFDKYVYGNKLVSDWGYFGLTDAEDYSPLLVYTLEGIYERLIGRQNYWVGGKYIYARDLPFWEAALKAVEEKYSESEEDIKAKETKAKRTAYNKKRWAEKKAQKLADSKPFDKFLAELKDKYGSGYIAQDVYGYTYVYKNKPYFTPTLNGWQDGEEVYEPGYWTGDTYDHTDYESQLNKAYKDQYRKSVPTASEAIWQF